MIDINPDDMQKWKTKTSIESTISVMTFISIYTTITCIEAHFGTHNSEIWNSSNFVYCSCVGEPCIKNDLPVLSCLCYYLQQMLFAIYEEKKPSNDTKEKKRIILCPNSRLKSASPVHISIKCDLRFAHFDTRARAPLKHFQLKQCTIANECRCWTWNYIKSFASKLYHTFWICAAINWKKYTHGINVNQGEIMPIYR